MALLARGVRTNSIETVLLDCSPITRLHQFFIILQNVPHAFKSVSALACCLEVFAFANRVRLITADSHSSYFSCCASPMSVLVVDRSVGRSFVHTPKTAQLAARRSVESLAGRPRSGAHRPHARGGAESPPSNRAAPDARAPRAVSRDPRVVYQ